MDHKEFFDKTGFYLLELTSKVIAFFVCIDLLITSGIISIKSFRSLYEGNLSAAIQDGLFVLILLEMFYVTRSFIKYGTINVSIVINVGLIAAIKQLIFELETLQRDTAIAFGIIFVTLSVTFYLEKTYFKMIVKPKLDSENLVTE